MAVTGIAGQQSAGKILKWNHGSEWWVNNEFCQKLGKLAMKII
jgi:hypothetical protein